MIRGSVTTHQHLVIHNQASMHDLAAPFRGHLFRCWRTFVGNHGLDFAAQTLLIKLECGLALALK